MRYVYYSYKMWIFLLFFQYLNPMLSACIEAHYEFLIFSGPNTHRVRIGWTVFKYNAIHKIRDNCTRIGNQYQWANPELRRYTRPCKSVLPRIMNFGRIRILNNIRIFKNDEYEYKYYLEFEKLFKYYSWEIFE